LLLAHPLRTRPERADVPRERLQIFARDIELEAIARIDVGRPEQRRHALPAWRIERNQRANARRDPGTPAAELVEIVQLGLVRGEYQEHCLVDRLGDLMELEGRDGRRAVREVALEALVELGCVLEVA
jgi:hypothetical protein